MNWLRLLLWKLGLVRLVVLYNYEGEEHLRIMYTSKWRKYPRAFYHSWTITLKPDGVAAGPIKRTWKEL